MRRTYKQNKYYKYMLRQLDAMVGPESAGLLIAILLDGLQEFTKGEVERNLRTLELKFNNFFTFTYNVDDYKNKREEN